MQNAWRLSSFHLTKKDGNGNKVSDMVGTLCVCYMSHLLWTNHNTSGTPAKKGELLEPLPGGDRNAPGKMPSPGQEKLCIHPEE